MPYAGFVGDYQAIQVLTPTANGFPWLAKLAGGTFTNQPAGATYTLVGDDQPQFLVHFDHQSRRVLLQVFQINTDSNGVKSHGRNWHKIIDEELLRPKQTPTGVLLVRVGRRDVRQSGGPIQTVPDGKYVVEISVLKALGDRTTRLTPRPGSRR